MSDSIPKYHAIILAAGKGTRMKSPLPKVVVSTIEKPMLVHVLDTLTQQPPSGISVVTGFKKEVVESVAQEWKTQCSNEIPMRFCVQEEQLGTGHAVGCAKNSLSSFNGPVMVLYGDVPLISGETLKEILKIHESKKSTVTILSAFTNEPGKLGRIVRDEKGIFKAIVEAKDCSPEQLAIKEINSGIMVIESSFLWPALEKINTDNAQNELYLTDIASIAVEEGQTVEVKATQNFAEVTGVNSRYDLAFANRHLRNQKIQSLFNEGVLFESPETFFYEGEITIGEGSRIGPNVTLIGPVSIGPNTILEGTAFIKNSTICADTTIKFSTRIEDSTIGASCAIGPFAHLRPNSKLESGVKVGNFVETKKAQLKEGVSAGHLSYLGDCTIGENTNIGAGTITCNYDGKNKHLTTIGKNVFVGSNSSLIAPLEIADNATIGAGSSISKGVKEGSLVLTRAPLKEKENYKRKSKL